MRRSREDLEHGTQLRLKLELLACPECGASTHWRNVSEYADHVRKCRVIALALAVGTVKMPPLDDMLPEVKRKPQGWDWTRR